MKGSLGAWGMSPNRHSIQPDFLGFGTVRLQQTGFLKVILTKADDLVKFLTSNVEMLNGFKGAVNLQSIPDIIKQLSDVQAHSLGQKMPNESIYQCTMGVGSILITPPGSLIMNCCMYQMLVYLFKRCFFLSVLCLQDGSASTKL